MHHILAHYVKPTWKRSPLALHCHCWEGFHHHPVFIPVLRTTAVWLAGAVMTSFLRMRRGAAAYGTGLWRNGRGGCSFRAHVPVTSLAACTVNISWTVKVRDGSLLPLYGNKIQLGSYCWQPRTLVDSKLLCWRECYEWFGLHCESLQNTVCWCWYYLLMWTPVHLKWIGS